MTLLALCRFLNVFTTDGAAVVRVSDGSFSDLPGHYLLKLSENWPGRRLKLDCGGVRALDSREMAFLISLHKRAKAQGGQLTLFNVKPEVYEALEVTLLTRLLDVRMSPWRC